MAASPLTGRSPPNLTTMTATQRITTLLALPLILAASARSQSDANPTTTTTTTVGAPPAAPAPSAATAPVKDKIVRLDEFEVSSRMTGYSASETMTGSRVNTKIADLPYSIVNLDDAFFKDFSVQILDENMTYIGGLTGLNIGGGFNLRGFASTSMLRDGFYRLGRYGLSNIQRVEVIRGPNAAVYGRSSPGGMVNFISLQPSKETQQSISYSQGSYKQEQGNVDLTGAIGQAAKTYYVLNLNQTSRDYPGQYSEIHNNEDFLGIAHDFPDGSHLQVSAEYFLQIQHAPQQAAPGAPLLSVARLATPDNSATSTAVGLDTGLVSFNPYGPNSELNRGSDTFTAAYNKSFNDVWSMKFGAYNFRARRWDFNQNTGWGAVVVPLNGAPVTDSRGALPSRGEIMEDGGGFQQDLLAHYWLFNHKVENNTLLTVDFNDYYRWDPTWNYSANNNPDIVAWAAPRTVTLTPQLFNGRIEYIPSAPVAYFPKFYNPALLTLFPATGATTGTLTRRRTKSLGGNFRQQMIFWDGRLITYAGIRNDTVLFSQRDYTVAFNSVGIAGNPKANQPGGSVVRRYEHQNKPNAGFNFKVTPNLHVYGSYSTAYFVDQTSRPSVIAAPTYAPFTARGFDYGIKGAYFDDQLNFTLGGFYDKQNNVLVTDTVEQPLGSGNFVNQTEQDGNQLVRGFEADLSWTVNHELTIGASGAEVNAIYTNFGSANPEVVGRSVNLISPENGSVYGKYNITSGPLKGLQFNPLVTYVSSTPALAPTTGDTLTIIGGKSVLTGHTDGWKIRFPSFTVWNLNVSYFLPHYRGYQQRITLSVNNVFDRYYLKIPSGDLADGRGFMVSYTLTHGSSH
jgi:iron complex outermembrane receptor protein